MKKYSPKFSLCVYIYMNTYIHLCLSLVAQATVKNLLAKQETQVWSLDQEDPLEKGMAPHSSILAWRISWTEEPGKLQSTGSQRVRHDWATNTHIHTCIFININCWWGSSQKVSLIISMWKSKFKEFLFICSFSLLKRAYPISAILENKAPHLFTLLITQWLPLKENSYRNLLLERQQSLIKEIKLIFHYFQS